jgi:exportin-5
MKHILGQVKDAWASEDLSNSVSTFQAFCGLLGMDRLPDFLLANNFQAVQDWSEQSLSSDGQALQAAILERSNVGSHRPLKLTY